MRRLFAIASISLAWALPQEGAWAQEGRPSFPKVLWRFVEPTETWDFSNPLVTEGLVVVGNGYPGSLGKGLLRAFRTEDGLQVWTHDHGHRIHDRPCADQEHIYFTSSQGLAAVSRKDGRPKWKLTILDGAGSPVVLPAKGLVFAGGNNGFVYAASTKTGEYQWKTSIVADAPPDPPGFPGQRARVGEAWARPTGATCDEARLYQSVFDQARVVALDVDTGKKLWSYQAKGWIYGAPVVSAQYILVGSQDKCLHCLDKRTGDLVWKSETKGRIEASAVVDANSVFFGSCDGGVYRLDLTDGKQRWKFDTEADPAGRRSIYSSPILTGDTIYIAATEGQVYALDRETGKMRWKLRAAADCETCSSPAFDGRRLFVVTRPDAEKRGQVSLVAIGTK